MHCTYGNTENTTNTIKLGRLLQYVYGTPDMLTPSSYDINATNAFDQWTNWSASSEYESISVMLFMSQANQKVGTSHQQVVCSFPCIKVQHSTETT
jgi:hypothetical protein